MYHSTNNYCPSNSEQLDLILVMSLFIFIFYFIATRDTILLSKKMAEAGADAVLVVNPFYFKASMTADALTRHFTKVSHSSS